MEEFLRQMMKEFNPYHLDKGMTYEDGLFLLAIEKYYQITHNMDYLRYVQSYVDQHVDSTGYIKNYHLEDYNIDNILAGNILFLLYDHFKDNKYLQTINLLREQLRTQPRTRSGSFWHKLRYPYQIWLDGLYMGQLFYLKYALLTREEDIFQDVLHQFNNVKRYLWDHKRKLYCHAFDEQKNMQWSDPITGRSANIWSRSVGWYAMALVEAYELFPLDRIKGRNSLSNLLEELLEGMTPHQDPKSHMWYQLVDKPLLEKNYLETSGSAMLAYAMLKGSRIGMIKKSYWEKGVQTVNGIEETYLKKSPYGYVLEGTCKVAGLDNEKRDGSDKYYLSEPIAANEIKGVAPYLFCLTELMRR
ncbi:MAG: glycoside hydrolase family 88 protein [Candidatus Izemoplasmatales bacterium]